jgi:hypothetical protein
MVLACIGNMLVIVPGMWIAHKLRWFVLVPARKASSTRCC